MLVTPQSDPVEIAEQLSARAKMAVAALPRLAVHRPGGKTWSVYSEPANPGEYEKTLLIQSKWSTAQGETAEDVEKALAFSGEKGLFFDKSGLEMLDSKIQHVFTVSKGTTKAKKKDADGWTISPFAPSAPMPAAQMASKPKRSRPPQLYLVLARRKFDGKKFMRIVVARRPDGARGIARAAWKKEHVYFLEMLLAVSRKDLRERAKEIQAVERGGDPEFVWPESTDEELAISAEKFSLMMAEARAVAARQ